jgi:UDP-N-acetylglucosamine:LPS N-acetylglucosamine transferase
MSSVHARPILIMAGGTGGHVFPALALARLLRAKSFEVIWLGTQRCRRSEFRSSGCLWAACVARA